MNLPTFIIGGAPKSGTTSVYNYLSCHPDVMMCRLKEPDYFDKHYRRGIAWYASLFDAWNGEMAIGEASTDMLASKDAPDRIKDLIPDVKMIFILRDPVKRAYSHYWYRVMRGIYTDKDGFSKFIRNEDNEWRNEMLNLGMYGGQVNNYVDKFGRDKIGVYIYDDLMRDADGFMSSIFEFIGVDDSFKMDERSKFHHNTTSYPKSPNIYLTARSLWAPLRARLGESFLDQIRPVRNTMRSLFFTSDKRGKPEFSESDLKYLACFYQESNDQLEELIGRDLSHWTKP